ncbi:hypothetical protein [Mangrovimonas sp. ST2L15]|uniref:hypothetical protein n=1 Tax=Mangrovimonas sp. ST2L15 TaxID=1645916 RepID=UPI0006B56B22|nr:hypothetical protein [Mangrovimonas sp. ST2L15]
MNLISKYAKFIPYLYYITVIAFWFTSINRAEGLIAYPILLAGVPFLWQLVKPNKKLNALLGITFACLSSYMIIAYVSDKIHVIHLSYGLKEYFFYGGFFVLTNFVMAVWMIKNALRQSF